MMATFFCSFSSVCIFAALVHETDTIPGVGKLSCRWEILSSWNFSLAFLREEERTHLSCFLSSCKFPTNNVCYGDMCKPRSVNFYMPLTLLQDSIVFDNLVSVFYKSSISFSSQFIWPCKFLCCYIIFGSVSKIYITK